MLHNASSCSHIMFHKATEPSVSFALFPTTPSVLLSLLGLLRLDLLYLLSLYRSLSDRFYHTFIDLTIFIDSRVIDSVDPSLLVSMLRCLRAEREDKVWKENKAHLVDEDTEYDVISEACESMKPWHSDTESCLSAIIYTMSGQVSVPLFSQLLPSRK